MAVLEGLVATLEVRPSAHDPLMLSAADHALMELWFVVVAI